MKKIGILVIFFMSISCGRGVSSSELMDFSDSGKFYYVKNLNRCQNSNGDVGYNEGVLGECGGFSGHVFEEDSLSNIDLTGSNLVGAKFWNMTIRGVNFTGAKMARASFQGAKVSSSIFNFADLSRATFSESTYSWNKAIGSNMDSTSFYTATVSDSHFDHSNLRYTSFRDAQIRASHFDSASLYSTSFYGARLSGSTFVEAKISSADFLTADCSRCDFTRVPGMGRTNFNDANMRSAIFIDADLGSGTSYRAQFDGANFRGATLRSLEGPNFFEESSRPTFRGSYYNSATKLPFTTEEARKRGMIAR
jgi:uncharacterized protein YjbI with pentapeptide repeats